VRKALFEAGLPLDRGLAILEELAPSPRVRTIVTDLLHSVRGGSSLSEALTKHHPRPFSRLYINMIRAGERGGVLEVTLRRLAEFLEARAAFSEAVITGSLPRAGEAAQLALHKLHEQAHQLAPCWCRQPGRPSRSTPLRAFSAGWGRGSRTRMPEKYRAAR